MSPIDKQVLLQVAETLSELLPNIVIEDEYNVSGKIFFIQYALPKMHLCLFQSKAFAVKSKHRVSTAFSSGMRQR